MKIYKLDNGIPVKMWLKDIEDGAVAQLNNLSMLPFAYSHIAVMPDCHQGYGMQWRRLVSLGIVLQSLVRWRRSG